MRRDGVFEEDGAGEAPLIRFGGDALHEQDVLPRLRERGGAGDDVLVTHPGERELDDAVLQTPRMQERHRTVLGGIAEQVGVTGLQHQPGAHAQTERGKAAGEPAHTDERPELLARVDEAERRVSLRDHRVIRQGGEGAFCRGILSGEGQELYLRGGGALPELQRDDGAQGRGRLFPCVEEDPLGGGGAEQRAAEGGEGDGGRRLEGQGGDELSVRGEERRRHRREMAGEGGTGGQDVREQVGIGVTCRFLRRIRDDIVVPLLLGVRGGQKVVRTYVDAELHAVVVPRFFAHTLKVIREAREVGGVVLVAGEIDLRYPAALGDRLHGGGGEDPRPGTCVEQAHGVPADKREGARERTRHLALGEKPADADVLAL